MSFQRRGIGEFATAFGSLASYVKGDIEIINDDVRRYAFSNVFDVAANAAPYEKIVVAKNRQYVIETLRAEGTSDWFSASHDEFAIIPEATLNLGLNVTRGLTAFAGYNFMYIDNVARPMQQINPIVNSATVPFTSRSTLSTLLRSEGRWVIVIIVILLAFACCNARRRAASPALSRFEFGSSSTTMRGSPKKARARAMRCF